MLRLVCLLTLVLSGCHGPLVAALEERHVQSCVWSSLPWGRAVTATGGVDVQTCLTQRHTWP